MIKITKQILLLVIIILLIGIIYFVSNYFLDSDLRKESKKISEKELYITNKFRNLVDETKLKEGFWYTTKDKYGNETIAFFDPAALVAANLTQEEIDAIYNQVKGSRISDKDSYKMVPEEGLSKDMQFYNSVISSSISQDDNKYLDIKSKLIAAFASGKATKDDLVELSYIYGFEGDYVNRDLINKKLCSAFKIKCSNGGVEVNVFGVVKDSRGWTVQNASISVLGGSNTKTILSDRNGEYRMPINVDGLQKIRFKITKRGYSDAIVNVNVLTSDKKIYQADTAVITSANYLFTLDNVNKTITGTDNKIEGNNAIVKTSQSVYTIPMNIFFDKSGKRFSGQIEIVAYEFNRETVPISIMAVDTFDAARGYAGNLMQSFGMPYVQFYDKEGNELFVKKSLPIKLVYKMYHMGDLYSGSTKIYEPVTEKEVKEMLSFCEKSKETYPITRQFLIDTRMLKFPAWWIFDQSKGVWGNEGYKLLDASGTIETIFYTIKDVI